MLCGRYHVLWHQIIPFVDSGTCVCEQLTHGRMDVHDMVTGRALQTEWCTSLPNSVIYTFYLTKVYFNFNK